MKDVELPALATVLLSRRYPLIYSATKVLKSLSLSLSLPPPPPFPPSLPFSIQALQGIWSEPHFQTAHSKMEGKLKHSQSLKDKEKFLKLATIDM
jgi:hypothetical protein